MGAVQIELVVAVGENGVIGNNGTLPWRLPADLSRFRELTMGHPVLMGRRTFQSLAGPLVGRTLIVCSRTMKPQKTEELLVVNSFQAALDVVASQGLSKLMVSGGREVYEQAYPFADKMHLTLVSAKPDGDTHFPFYPVAQKDWVEVKHSHHPADEKNQYAMTFITYHRKVQILP